MVLWHSEESLPNHQSYVTVNGIKRLEMALMAKGIIY